MFHCTYLPVAFCLVKLLFQEPRELGKTPAVPPQQNNSWDFCLTLIFQQESMDNQLVAISNGTYPIIAHHPLVGQEQ